MMTKKNFLSEEIITKMKGEILKGKPRSLKVPLKEGYERKNVS
jgi:hypothetical protein